MPLETYREKRDFGATPEPLGEPGPEHERRAFVIQKHAASRLHWDFRIELDGVLVSWAVPKGPSYDTAQKRLAVHVEDHPLDYGGFEGTIPAGQYGGGTVMLWDRGWWEPFVDDEHGPAKHLAEGHLKMVLHGERLQGRWVVVRTRGYGGTESWLLIKEHDGAERPHDLFDATAEWVTSVSTGRTMEQIAAGAEAAGNDPAGAPTETPAAGPEADPMPESIDVELATLVTAVPEGERWLHEVKFDGYRIVAFRSAAGVRLVSRNNHDWTDRFPQIAEAVAALSKEPFILDGEVVALRADGAADFQALQNLAHRHESANLRYQAFDLLYAGGRDLRSLPLTARKEALARLVNPRATGVVRYTDHIVGHGDMFFDSACEYSLEGAVSKLADSPYRAGRHRDWAKAKCLHRQEFVVVGWTDPAGSRTGFGALALGVWEEGKLRAAGHVGTGFSETTIAAVSERLRQLATDASPLVDPPDGPAARGVHWVRPELVAEVSFAEWTASHQLRHPVFLGLREDKSPAEALRERATPPPAPPPADKPAGPSPVIAHVRLTNPDRVLWPDASFTKLQLARYYEAVAEFMLPHVANRPLSLVRCPDGLAGECFYQKTISHFPPAVKTVPIYVPDDDQVKPFGRITGTGGLVALAQMGVLEIHPWGSRTDDAEKPDRLIFDLDPDPDLPFRQVAGTALLLRRELEALGLRSWLKTTGGKGLHVVVPVERRYTWDEVRRFAKAFVESVVAIEPRMFTSSMSKSLRTGRIFIDYLRNARGATAVGAYSTRARPGVPVAVPLHWSEIEDAEGRPWFSATDVMGRVGESGFQDPWAELGSWRQRISAGALRAANPPQEPR